MSKKILELRARWQQELETRATFEQERMLSGEPLDFEPYAFSYCQKLSSTEELDVVSGKPYSLYVLCAVANPEGGCEVFEGRSDDG